MLGDVGAVLRKLRPHRSIRIGLRAIGSGFDRNRGEFRFRPEPLRRQHDFGKIEAEELVGAILVGDSHAAQHQEPGTNDCRKCTFQDHSRPPETKEKTNYRHHVGSRHGNASRSCRQGYRETRVAVKSFTASITLYSAAWATGCPIAFSSRAVS